MSHTAREPSLTVMRDWPMYSDRTMLFTSLRRRHVGGCAHSATEGGAVDETCDVRKGEGMDAERHSLTATNLAVG